jgi:hypothetical protein
MWWTTRAEQVCQKRQLETEILAEVSQHLGLDFLHVRDRGFAGTHG